MAGFYFQKAVRINPEYAEAWYKLGFAYRKLGERSKVMEVYKRLKTLDPVMAEEFSTKVVMP